MLGPTEYDDNDKNIQSLLENQKHSIDLFTIHYTLNNKEKLLKLLNNNKKIELEFECTINNLDYNIQCINVIDYLNYYTEIESKLRTYFINQGKLFIKNGQFEESDKIFDVLKFLNDISKKEIILPGRNGIGFRYTGNWRIGKEEY